MIKTKLRRKIIGMNRNPIMNTSYTPEALDEFLHGHKGAWADESRKEQLKWPEVPLKEKNLIWPSKVFLYPSLAIVEDVYLNINSKCERINNPKHKEPNPNYSIDSINQIDLTNYFDLMNSEAQSALGQLHVHAKENTSLSISSSDRHDKDLLKTPNESPHFNEIFDTSHDILKKLSLSCAEDGERIARIHCYRPFFKKIDGLCDRIRQDLIHHDSVIANVKSKGLVWAIKDLVFVCTRIINAWNITKGYVYDPSEGLNKVRSTLTPEFIPSFVAWQETTFAFIESLLVSFLGLDLMVHTLKEPLNTLQFQKMMDDFMKNLTKQLSTCEIKNNNKYWEQCSCHSCQIIVSSKAKHNALMELSVVCSEYGEKVAQNYTRLPYFKKIDSLCHRTKFELINRDGGALYNLNSQGTVWAVKELIFASTRIINAWNVTKGYVYGSSEDLNKVQKGMSCNFVANFTAWQKTTIKFIENLRMSFLRLDNLAHSESNNFKKDDAYIFFSKPIQFFKDRLQQLKSGEIFFQKIFCQNYFPHFIAETPDFMDLRSVIHKCQSGGYMHINEVVHDVRFIIYQVNKYLMRHIEPNLDRAVMYFQADVEKILAGKPFEEYNFNHIQGIPDEILFLYN